MCWIFPSIRLPALHTVSQTVRILPSIYWINCSIYITSQTVRETLQRILTFREEMEILWGRGGLWLPTGHLSLHSTSGGGGRVCVCEIVMIPLTRNSKSGSLFPLSCYVKRRGRKNGPTNKTLAQDCLNWCTHITSQPHRVKQHQYSLMVVWCVNGT